MIDRHGTGSTDGVLRGRRVLTLAPGVEGESVWWEQGRIRMVGSAAQIECAAPRRIPRYDLPRALVTPGLVDGHTHLALWALNRRRVELEGLRTREEVLARVAAAHPVQGWVIGQGWDANDWSSPPDRWALDRIQQVPVYLDSHDVHAAWLNSAALHQAGITRDVPDPYGGQIVRDANGEPTGLLLDRAIQLVTPHLPLPPAQVLDDALREAQTEAHRVGLTGIHEVESLDTLAAFQRLETAGELRLRVLFHPPVAALPTLIRRGMRSGGGSRWVTIGGVKIFLDGSLGSRTAWMLEPYAGTTDRGMPLSSEREAREAMSAAAKAGLATTVHAIGDAAVRRALDLVSELPSLTLPHRIEHFQCVHPADLTRVSHPSLMLSMQPAHLFTDIPLVDRHWGERGSGAYAYRSLIKRGAQLIFGSDVPVSTLDPRAGIHAAMERRSFEGAPGDGWHPEEKLGFSDVIRAYTVTAARAAGAGNRRGPLAPGLDADLVAWSLDSDTASDDAGAFRHGRAVLTVVGGAVVMQV
jgi:predicted amidohydrolase YtcJ